MTSNLTTSKSYKLKSWYVVFINAFVGCGIAAGFPQFSMTVNQLSERSGISVDFLLTSDTIKSCGIVASMLISGVVYNRFGARKTFIYAALAAIVPQFLLPSISSIPILIVVKIFQGTASLIFPVFLVIILNWIDEKNAGLSTAIFNGIFYGGGGIGGTFAGFVIANSGWVESYYALGIVQIAICLLWLFTVKERPPHKPATLKVVSSDAETTLDTGNKPAAKHPGEKNLLASGKIWLLAISFFSTTWAVQAITVDMSLFGADLGYDDMSVAKLLNAVTIGMIVSCLVSGKFSDFFASRTGRKDIARLSVLMVGHILIIVSVCLILLANLANFSVFFIVTFLFTFGSSWGLGAFYSILPEIYSEDKVPVVTGITGGVGDFGMPISPMVVGVIFGVNGHWNIGWASCAVIALVSLLAALVLTVNLKGRAKKPQR